MNSRRQLLERRSFLSGAFRAIGLVGASTLFEKNVWAAAVAFEPDMGEAGYQAKLFDSQQMDMLRALTDLVLPKTETPGGVELRVHQFLDHQLYSCYREGDQNRVKLLLAGLDQHSNEHMQKPFLELSHEHQRELLSRLEQLDGFSEADKQDFVFTKTLMVFGYFTSEVGATQVLQYQAVPGGFVGSIPYASVGKAWGSVEFY